MIKYLKTGAIFSEDGKYRYDLSRIWREGGQRINFIGLNPSTANKETDDPTIRRCVKFAESWGYGEMHMLNLFAYVSSDPQALLFPNPDPVGPENDNFIKSLDMPIVIAWGSWGKLWANKKNSRAEEVVRFIHENGYIPWCLGVNPDGEPKHPLYLLATTKLERY